MRQTSRAVALLLALESAQASVTVTDIGATYAKETGSTEEFQDFAAAWNVANPAYGGTTARPSNLSNRQGAYQTEFSATTWTWGAVTIQKANTVATKFTGSKSDLVTDIAIADLVVVKPGSGCMACLGSSMSNVWCSRTYSFLVTTSSSPKYQYEQVTGALSMARETPTTDTLAKEGAYDGGSCCDTNANFLLQTGQINKAAVITGWEYSTGISSTDDATSGKPNGAPAWAATCVAITNASYS